MTVDKSGMTRTLAASVVPVAEVSHWCHLSVDALNNVREVPHLIAKKQKA